jgi:transcriptional regulator with XRE-family HTH domain
MVLNHSKKKSNIEMMTNISKRFGQTVRKARELRGLSQADLAKQLGLSQVTIHKIEHGQINISLERAAALAGKLEISISDFIENSNGKCIADSDQSPEILEHLKHLREKYIEG